MTKRKPEYTFVSKHGNSSWLEHRSDMAKSLRENRRLGRRIRTATVFTTPGMVFAGRIYTLDTGDTLRTFPAR